MTLPGCATLLHSSMLPRIALNCGWLIKVVNHLLTLAKGFLKAASNTYLYGLSKLHATTMSAKVSLSPTKYVRVSKWLLSIERAALISSLALWKA